MRDGATAMKFMMYISCNMKGKPQPKLILNLKAVVTNKVKSVMGVSAVV